jgi:hypothetical protein
MDKKEKKMGFSGLSDLVSEVSDVYDVVISESKSEARLSSATTGDEHKPKPLIYSPTFEFGRSWKNSGNSGWKLILGIVGVAVVICIANNGGQDTKKSSPNMPSPTQNMNDELSNRSILAGEIENGKLRAKQMEAQIEDIDDSIEGYKRKLSGYQASGMTDEHNILVPLFNSLVGRRNDLYEEYSQLIDDINDKVEHYNTGYR